MSMESCCSPCSCEQRRTPARKACAEVPDHSQRHGGVRYRSTSGRWRAARCTNSTSFLLAAVLLLMAVSLPSGNTIKFNTMFGGRATPDLPARSDLPARCDHALLDTAAASCTEVGRDVAACSQCMAGEWCRPINGTVVAMESDGNASFVCEPCPAGCFQSHPGQLFCLVCDNGNFSSMCNQSDCERCPSGHYSPKDDQLHTLCEECAVGTNQTRPGNSSCHLCPPNHMCNTTGCDHCQRCQIGGQAIENRTACEPCQEGKYNPGFLEHCFPCPAGSANNQIGRRMCEPCQIGHFAHRPGELTCTQCPLGHYQDQMGASTCPRCPRGHYATAMASPTCAECGVGFYCPTADNPPLACPADAYCPKGSDAPQYCPAMYNLNSSQNGCAMSGGLIGIIAATILVNIIIITALIWHYYRKKRLYTGRESQPLVWRKETLSRDPPVYDGF